VEGQRDRGTGGSWAGVQEGQGTGVTGGKGWRGVTVRPYLPSTCCSQRICCHDSHQ